MCCLLEYVFDNSLCSMNRFTYLDSELNGGRPVIILHAKNLVPEHDKQVHISYTFNKPRMFVEPLMLVGTFFAFFLLCTVLARTGAAPRATASKKSESITTVDASN